MIEACPMHVLVRLEMSGGSTEAHEQTMSSEEPRERERERAWQMQLTIGVSKIHEP